MSHSPTQSRDAVSASDCWDLTPLFPDTDQWETLYKNLEERLPGYERFKGSLGDSLEVFSDALAFDHDMARDLEKIYTFAHLKNDEDKTQSLGEDIFQRAMNLYTRIMDASSFMVPEIQALGKEKLTTYMADERLKDYEFYLEKIIRNIPHTRDAQVEQILAMAGESLSAPRQIFSQLDNADLVFGTIRDKEGKSKDLTHGNFVTFLSQGDREIRKQAFHQYYEVYDRHKHSIAASLGASIKKDFFLARARNFSTARQASLFKDNVPEAVYEKLISSVRQGLSGLHNYLNFRRKALGLETLCIYDTYVPVVPDVNFKMGYDEAVETCIKALAPLGEEYCSRLEKGLTRGWVDRYENKGKRSGAYSSGCYDSPPYILLNYEEGSINSLYTLIHEAGHSMHSHYSKENQPYPKADYTIFVAEVASTLNETLLTRYLLKKYDDDPRMKAYILNREIDNIRATFFRQTMFAEFETIVHSKAAQNQALTLETFTSVYQELLDAYFGNEMEKEPRLALECLRIPHFYSSFYVYQYATGLAAALGIARRIQDKGQAAVDDYRNFLGLGGSMFPIEELKIAGVDMAGPEAIAATIDHFNARVAALEELWTSRLSQ